VFSSSSYTGSAEAFSYNTYNSESLTPGALAGIVIGIVAAVLVCIAGVFALVQRRSSKASASGEGKFEGEKQGGGKEERAARTSYQPQIDSVELTETEEFELSQISVN